MITLLPYTSKYKSQLLEIFRLNTPVYFASEEEKEFDQYLDVFAKDYLCIMLADIVIGGVGYDYRSNDSSGRINWIFLHPNHSGKGFGKMAVEYCIALLKKDGRATHFIARTSQHASHFFESCSFTCIGYEKNYWAQGLDLCLMRRELNP